MATASNTVALATNPPSKVVMLPTAAPRKVQNCRHVASRYAARALLNERTIKFPLELAREQKALNTKEIADARAHIAHLDSVIPALDGLALEMARIVKRVREEQIVELGAA